MYMNRRNHNNATRTGNSAYFSTCGILYTVLSLVFLTNYTFSQSDTINAAQPSDIPVEIINDWKEQDGSDFEAAIMNIRESLPDEYAGKISGAGEAGYISACHWRRVSRLQPLSDKIRELVYARHHNLGGTSIGYIEDIMSDGVSGIGDWGIPASGRSTEYPVGPTNSALLKLTFTDYYPTPEVIIEDTTGVIRDPCPSFDGSRIVFAHSKDNNGYHLNEITLESGDTRQLTDDPEGLTVSDFEPCILSNGDIIFSSTRCFGHVDVGVNITSNLFICNKDGRYLRRIGYDQVHTFYPTLVEDGTVMYTRWEYNDRNIRNNCGIFTMNQDGGRQSEFFGNQTAWPACILQARTVPGNPVKALAIISDINGPYAGDLAMIDISISRNGSDGVQLVAPERPAPVYNGVSDTVPDENKLFQNPYPLSKRWFLISYRKYRDAPFQIFLMNTRGERELLAWDVESSVSQPFPLAARMKPLATRSMLDYSSKTSAVSVIDVYYGSAMEGVPRGEVEKIRAVGVEYRTDPGFGYTSGEVIQMTPIGRYGCSWLAKWIIGECQVESDGSAAFEVPPNTPFFLQLIGKDGSCIQTMRSWMTLMPGERFDCSGCHEDKNSAALTGNPIAFTPTKLKPFYDLEQKPGTFYYPEVIQPILDKNCVRGGCHDQTHAKLDLRSEKIWTNDLDDTNNNTAYRYWNRSYYNLSDSNYVYCNVINGTAGGIAPHSTGSSKSKLITMLRKGHNDVQLSDEEMEKLCAWIDLSIPHSGTYTDDMTEEHRSMYLSRLARREKEEALEQENIRDFIITEGGYKVLPDIGIADREMRRRIRHQKLSLKWHFTDHHLYVTVPSDGKLLLSDIKGRCMVSRHISGQTGSRALTMQLKSDNHAGTYVIVFEGNGNRIEQVVTHL